MNLLNNAAKFTDRGGCIRLTAEREGPDVVVRVRDTGIGIPADRLSSIFELFAQVDRTLEKARGGLGIGLTLVRRLVELHGGTVEARSDGPGKGSEFVVRLPVLADRPTDPPTLPGDRPPSTPGLRILIADDNRDGADSLAEMLKQLGHDTRTVYDGEAAVSMAREFRPEVALLDIGMPRLNGFDTCRRIREQPGGTGILLIALTGWGQDGDIRRSQEAGFDHHLVKPADPLTLLNLLTRVRAAPSS